MRRSRKGASIPTVDCTFGIDALALAVAGVLEQVLVLARLRAPVLLRRMDASAQSSRRMPGPARVVQHGTGERDRIRLAVGDDCLGLLRVGDQADGDRRKADFRLDPLN